MSGKASHRTGLSKSNLRGVAKARLVRKSTAEVSLPTAPWEEREHIAKAPFKSIRAAAGGGEKR